MKPDSSSNKDIVDELLALFPYSSFSFKVLCSAIHRMLSRSAPDCSNRGPFKFGTVLLTSCHNGGRMGSLPSRWFCKQAGEGRLVSSGLPSVSTEIKDICLQQVLVIDRVVYNAFSEQK